VIWMEPDIRPSRPSERLSSREEAIGASALPRHLDAIAHRDAAAIGGAKRILAAFFGRFDLRKRIEMTEVYWGIACYQRTTSCHHGDACRADQWRAPCSRWP